jgi:hypothetical protein
MKDYGDARNLRTPRRFPQAALALAVSTVLFIAGCRAVQENPNVTDGTHGLTIQLTKEGLISGAVFGRDGVLRAITGGTRLAGCSVQGAVVRPTKQRGVLEFERELADARGHRCRLLERFSSTPTSVRWEAEITGLGEPWSTPIETWLSLADPAQVKFWSPWGDPRQGILAQTARPDLEALGVLPAAEVGDWADPLVAMPFTDARLSFGATPFTYSDPDLAFIPFRPDLFAIPLATIIETGEDAGLSLVLSPEDPYLDMMLTTTAGGGIVFSRVNHRIQAGKPVRFAADLVAHEGDWRGGLRWLVDRYPEYFDPELAAADNMAGTGAYSSYEGELDTARMKGMAFRVNWKASWDFPYMGMFLPPVGPGEEWLRFGGGRTSIARIRDYCRKMRNHGFYVLNYFNVTEFGAKVAWPPPPRKSTDEAGLWRDGNDFLYGRLADAILYVPPRTDLSGQKHYGQTKVDGPYYTWEGGIVLDAGEPVYRDFLLDQARRHIEEIPESFGICIDRMDWLRMYNERRDDGASWFGGQPVRSLFNSWRDLMSRLGPLVHGAGKVIFVNNHTKRVDLLRYADGFFDEFTYRGVPLNLTALLGIRKTVLGWTESAGDLEPDPDAFFQRYLYMGVYPMAPYPGNDHSLEPGAAVERYYLDYGPLLDAMRGKKWVLASHAVDVEDEAAIKPKANLFRVPGGFAIPVVFGGKRQSVTVVLRGLAGIGPETACRAIHPGSVTPVPVTIARRGNGEVVLNVPVIRGCAMVRIDAR